MSQFVHGLAEQPLVRQLLAYTFLRAASGLLAEICVHPDLRLHPETLVRFVWR